MTLGDAAVAVEGHLSVAQVHGAARSAGQWRRKDEAGGGAHGGEKGAAAGCEDADDAGGVGCIERGWGARFTGRPRFFSKAGDGELGLVFGLV